jgi:hypothetical protein
LNLLYEIRNGFASLKKNTAIKIESLSNNYPAWIIRSDDWYGVGIPYNSNIEISERFSNVRLWNNNFVINEKEYSILLLTCTLESLRTEFASLSAQFIDPGEEGTDRKALIQNPFDWWVRWRSLLGNTIQEKSVYSVLGELLVLEKLIINGENPIWSGIRNATHDIETSSQSYEVKSTIVRYDAVVTINSQYQLQSQGNSLNLIFCRFEESVLGQSITDVLKRLEELGMSIETLNSNLEKIGLESGSSAMKQKYKLLEMRKYLVDEKFPAITEQSFTEKRIPDSIIHFTYKVDLNGLDYEIY